MSAELRDDSSGIMQLCRTSAGITTDQGCTMLVTLIYIVSVIARPPAPRQQHLVCTTQLTLFDFYKQTTAGCILNSISASLLSVFKRRLAGVTHKYGTGGTG